MAFTYGFLLLYELKPAFLLAWKIGSKKSWLLENLEAARENARKKSTIGGAVLHVSSSEISEWAFNYANIKAERIGLRF